jgi:hypothetical protein
MMTAGRDQGAQPRSVHPVDHTPQRASMSGTAERFCATLRRERERRGIRLADVAASTKIALPLLEALERNDFRRWPAGIYGRAFIRAYVLAIGLPPEPLVAEFVGLFPDDAVTSAEPAAEQTAPAPSVVAPAPAAPRSPLALTLALDPPRPRLSDARLLAALIEWTAVVSLGVVGAWVFGVSLLAGAGALALVYYPLMTAATGESLAARWVRRHLRHNATALRFSGRDLRGPAHDAGAVFWSTLKAFPEHLGRLAWRRWTGDKA